MLRTAVCATSTVRSLTSCPFLTQRPLHDLQRRIGPVLGSEEMRVGRRRRAVVAVVAARIARELEATLMSELVRSRRADAAAESLDERGARGPGTTRDVAALRDGELDVGEHIEPHAARAGCRIGDAGRAEVQSPPGG